MAQLSLAVSLTNIARLADWEPLRVVLLSTDSQPGSMTVAGLAHPWRIAERKLGTTRCRVHLFSVPDAFPPDSLAPTLALLAADHTDAVLPDGLAAELIAYCRLAPLWGAVGAAVPSLLQANCLHGVRAVLPWHLRPEAEITHGATLLPELYSIDQGRVTGCGGTASADLALSLIGLIYGEALQAEIMQALYIDRVRAGHERQPLASILHPSHLQPILSEAVELMEANIEEPLPAEQIAHLVGLSSRQLERQFKQHLGKLPARYYLELRLQRARKLLRTTHHSIVQIGLMCGFVSPSHFASAYGNLFGITPREERQRKLQQS